MSVLLEQAMFWAIAGIAAYLMYKANKKLEIEITDKVERQVYEGPMHYDVIRSVGHQLTNTGKHIEELLKVESEPATLQQIKQQYSDTFKRNPDLLNDTFIEGKRDVMRKQQWRGPSDEVSQPLAHMQGSWYKTAYAMSPIPYVTRVVPP